MTIEDRLAIYNKHRKMVDKMRYEEEDDIQLATDEELDDITLTPESEDEEEIADLMFENFFGANYLRGEDDYD